MDFHISGQIVDVSTHIRTAVVGLGGGACDGDGGAPLVCQSKDNRWNVVGLVTWGVDCAQRGVPGVYANVYNMLSFILNA